MSSFFPCSLEIHAHFLCVVYLAKIQGSPAFGPVTFQNPKCPWLIGSSCLGRKSSVTRLWSWSVLLVPGCWQPKKTGRGRMPFSWKMSAGGKGAAHKAHECVSKRRVPTLLHETGVPFKQAKSNGISSAEPWGSWSFSSSGNFKALNETKMCIWFALFHFPALHAALVSGGPCFFEGIWLVSANSTNWAFCLERPLSCKRMRFLSGKGMT